MFKHVQTKISLDACTKELFLTQTICLNRNIRHKGKSLIGRKVELYTLNTYSTKTDG